jgi:hypothetical protein
MVAPFICTLIMDEYKKQRLDARSRYRIRKVGGSMGAWRQRAVVERATKISIYEWIEAFEAGYSGVMKVWGRLQAACACSTFEVIFDEHMGEFRVKEVARASTISDGDKDGLMM